MKSIVGSLAVAAVLLLTINASATTSSPVIVVHVTIHGHAETVQMPGIITFLPDKVKAGSVVTFKIRNADDTVHNFQIDGYQTRDIGPGGGRALISKVEFKRPGRYFGSSPSDNHSGIGGTFVVT